MDWQKNVTLYITSTILIILGLALQQIGILVFPIILLTYYLWEEKLEKCKIVKYLGYPLTILGFFILLWGIILLSFNGPLYATSSFVQYLVQHSSAIIIGGSIVELIGIILYTLGLFIAYYMNSK